MRQKALTRASRRIYAFKPVDEGLGTGRKVCRILEVPRSSYWYRPKEKTPWEPDLLKRVIELSDKQPSTAITESLPSFGRRDSMWSRGASGACGVLGAAGPSDQEENHLSRTLDRTAGEGRKQEPCLDLGLHLRSKHQGRSPAGAHNPG